MQPTWTDIGVFWISLLASVSALGSIALTAFIFLRTSRPEITVYTRQHEDQPSLINLVIENTGKATAHDIRFTTSEPIPEGCFGDLHSTVFTEGPLISGIPALTPGSRRAFLWGNYLGLSARLGDRRLIVRAKFKHAHPLSGIFTNIADESVIEIQSYHATDASDNTHMKKIADSVRDAAKSLASIDKTLKQK